MTSPIPVPEPLMTGQEVAAFLRVSLSMVYKLRREGRLPAIPVGALWRWNPEVVRALVRGEQAATTPPGALAASRRRRV